MQVVKRGIRAFCRGVRFFSLSVGLTAVCMLGTLGIMGPGAAQAMEASAFNGGAVEPQAAPVQACDANVGEMAVVPLGSAFGIKLFTDGVIVASLSDIYTESGVCCPAAEAGLQPGDYLVQADGMEIQSNAALAKYIGVSGGKPITFLVKRGEEQFEAVVEPVYGEGAFKTGIWVRDSAAGVGTLTFYDPQSGVFAGLGHGICDMDAGGVMALKSGEPAPITLCGVQKGLPDSPGQLRGYFASEDSMGRLLANNETGVYGILDQVPDGTPIQVLPRDEVREGAVKIMVSIDENGPRLYEAEIEAIASREQPTKNMVLRVTDPRLLESTGGIVQGMSGAPILQNGSLAGAVTHVFTEDPAMGYGIFAQTMLEQGRAITAAQSGQDAA